MTHVLSQSNFKQKGKTSWRSTWNRSGGGKRAARRRGPARSR